MGLSVCRHSFTWTTNTTGPFNPPNGYLTWCAACGTWGRWDGSKWVAQTESAGSIAIGEVERLHDALQAIYGHLAPASPECDGCAAEIDGALQIIKEVLLHER